MSQFFNSDHCHLQIVSSLKKVLIRYFKLNPSQLATMGKRSHELAWTSTPQQWAARMTSVWNE